MHRGDVITVHVDNLTPNPWNPNEQSERVYEAEKKSIKTLGFLMFPVVREVGDGQYQILDGEHRWKGVKDTGGDEITVNNLGPIDDDEAMMVTELMNSLRGQPDPIKQADMLNEILASRPEWKELLPYSDEHLESMLNPSCDWESLGKEDPEAGDKDKDSGLDFGATLKINMSPEQLETCEQAIARAKDVGDCTTDARAMELICADFLSG